MGNPLYLPNLRKVAYGTLVDGEPAVNVALPAGTEITAITAQNSNGENTEGTVSTVITLTPPANAVGFLLMNNDTSTANIRWRVGAVATASAGSQLQPGRDTGYIPCAAAISVCAESGTQDYNIQWVLSS